MKKKSYLWPLWSLWSYCWFNSTRISVWLCEYYVEELEIENDSSCCLDVENIVCVKNLSLLVYLNDDDNYDDEEVIDDLDKIIEDNYGI